MPKRIAPLSDIQVKNAKPQEKDYKLMDGFGLFLLVTPTNGKLWRFDYRFDNKRKMLALGAYPSEPLPKPGNAAKMRKNFWRTLSTRAR